MTSAACSICSRPVRTRAALLPARWAPRDITRSPRARTRFARNPAPGPPPLKPWPGPRGTWPRLTGTRGTGLGGQRGEEGPDVLDEQFGRFQRGEMATGLEVAPVHDVVGALGVAADGDVLGEDGHAGRHAGGNGPVARMHRLVVDIRRGARGPGEPVHADIGEHLVPRDRVLRQRVTRVGPLLELLRDPGKLPVR